MYIYELTMDSVQYLDSNNSDTSQCLTQFILLFHMFIILIISHASTTGLENSLVSTVVGSLASISVTFKLAAL